MPRYERPIPGDDGWTDWVQPVKEGYKMCCCDCGLVHEMDFRVYKGRAQFRARRSNRSTAAVRKKGHDFVRAE